MDLFNLVPATQKLDPYSSTLCVYFPFAFIFLYPIALLPQLIGLSMLCLLPLSVLVWYLSINLPAENLPDRLLGIVVVVLLSYPVLFAIDRANIELLVIFLEILFIEFFRQGKILFSVIVLSMAIAMKAYPVLFVLILFREKQYLAVMMTCLITMVLTLLSLSVFQGNIIENVQKYMNVMESFQQNYVFSWHGVQHNLSLWGTIKILVAGIVGTRKFSPQVLETSLKIYSSATVLVLCYITYYILYVENYLWRQVTILVICMLLLPPVSFDYKLIHIFIPAVLFLNARQHSQLTAFYLICFALLLVPKNYLILDGDISAGVIVNTFILTAMLLVLIVEGLLLYRSCRSKAIELNRSLILPHDKVT